GNARWSAIKLRRTGVSNDPDYPFAKNTDVKFVHIYQDSNQNDSLDINDENISQAQAELHIEIDAAAAAPFDIAVKSTEGFTSSGRLYVSNVELMTYSGISYDGVNEVYLISVVSRGDKLGDSGTPVITHDAGASVKKVDLFDQDNPLNTQIIVYLAKLQTLSPLPQSFFVAYDIGETAIKSNKVGVSIRDKSWITVNAPHDVSPKINMNVTNSLPQGTYEGVYPFSSSLVQIRAVSLSVESISMAPKSAERDAHNIPVLTVKMKTLSDYVNIGQLNLFQTGTISTATAGVGDGEFSSIELWKDNGDDSFSPLLDEKIGFTTHSAINPFKSGISVSILYNKLPYIVVGTETVGVHIVSTIGNTDLSGQDILGHYVGINVEAFSDIKGPNGWALGAGQDATSIFPLVSNSIIVAPAIIPLTPVYNAITMADNGYPAYALLDSSGNIVYGANNCPVVDTSKWIYDSPDTLCGATEPLIDINDDNVPDNFDFFKTGKCLNISLNNSGLPTFDIDSDRILDFESNLDYVADGILDDGG
ncbi:MAG: hypothetical protein KAI33_10430, partial [Elusimicrobiales bacterium]|nr:hypothetical protein [Elusimicrobiales bacterium]